MSKQFTTEELVGRWEDYQEIVNLMGRRSFYNLWKLEDKVWEEMWCKKAPDPCLGFNDGYYKGYEAVEGWFKATKELGLLKARVAKKNHPELADKTDEELYGVGSLTPDNLTTPLVYIAEDGQTAKGMWYALAHITDYTEAGPTTIHQWGWIAVDFVKEDGAWKIWHLLDTPEIKHVAGKKWYGGYEPKPVDPAYAEIGEFEFPKPNVPMKVNELLNAKRPGKPNPLAPRPYDTFANTFSYGI